MLGVFVAAAICDTPVQLAISAEAELIRQASVPRSVFPVRSTALCFISFSTVWVIATSPAVPVIKILYPLPAASSASRAKYEGGHCRHPAREPGCTQT